MATDDMEIVSALCARLAEKIGSQRYELWFGNGTRLQLHDGALVVEVADVFFRDWLRTHFRTDLEAVSLEVLGQKLAIQFRVDRSLASSTEQMFTAGPPAGAEAAQNSTNARQPSAAPSADAGTRTDRSGPAQAQPNGRRPYAELSAFVVSHCNRLAYTSAQIVAQQPGHVSPLVIHGGPGVGKTHLLEGIWTAARRTDSGVHAIYLTAERFTTCFLEALGGRGLPSFRQKYRGVDLLLIDDVQFFAGKKATLVELLYTVDTLLKAGRQLVFASDRSPAELKSLGPEIVTRLSGGLVCRVEPPDYATRLGIVRQLSHRLQLEVSENVLALVASQVTSSARELSGALNRLQVMSLAHGQPITRSLAEQALADLKDQLCPPVHLPDIQRAVCAVFGIEPESLQAKTKVSSVSHPRMLAMWLARKHTRAALSEIGDFFGRRSHSTVISAQKKVERWMQSQERLQLSKQTCNVEEAIRRVEETLRTA